MVNQNNLSFKLVENFKTYNNRDDVLILLKNHEAEIKEQFPSLLPLSIEEVIDSLTESSTLILLYLGADLVGVSVLKVNCLIKNFEHEEDNVLIKFTLIKEGHRGFGLGRLLYREVEDVCKEEFKKKKIFRGVWGFKQSTHALYTSLGYELIYKETYTYPSSKTRLVYGKKLHL